MVMGNIGAATTPAIHPKKERNLTYQHHLLTYSTTDAKEATPMPTLCLNPAVAAARRAAKAASAMPAPAAEPPTPTSASPATLPNKHGRLKAELDALEAKLRRVWPHCFSTSTNGGSAPVPLAVGIRHDIAKHLSPDEQKLLPGVLHRWVKRKSYLKACVQSGAHRVGLDGTLTPISEKEVTYAREKLAAVVSERATERQVTP